MNRRMAAAVVGVFCCCAISCGHSVAVHVGSKEFTESVILGELATRLAKAEYPAISHLKALGGTRVLWDALLKGDIDLYPEYTGTLAQEIFAGRHVQSQIGIREALADSGVHMSGSLGFDDSYALGMKDSTAAELKISTISDLKKYPRLSFGFSNEFMDRADGWGGLRLFYGLPQRCVAGLEHQLAYRALDNGNIAVTDLYGTDADILYYRLRVLKDDRHFFPDYTAVLLYRDDLPRKAPSVIPLILRLQGAVSQADMIRMNERVKVEGAAAEKVASDFLAEHFAVRSDVESDSLVRRLLLRTRQHTFLVSVSLIAAILVSIPLGTLAFVRERPGQIVLAVVGVIQTIPSLALIVFMIPLLGIGNVPAIVALFLYSLLPIVRGTHAGLKEIPMPLRESAEALGLPKGASLRLIELPIASRSILSGIKTSAVINVGTATLGALIGAGGYGQPILTGIRLNNVGLILEGAIPAAVLALTVQGLFDLLEAVVVPKGLRMKSDGLRNY
jgi:osmoprotectant transport system permease protein